MKLYYTSDRNQTLDVTYQRGELITRTQNVTAAYIGDDSRGGNEELGMPKSIINGLYNIAIRRPVLMVSAKNRYRT
jgi:hypothetical protein